MGRRRINLGVDDTWEFEVGRTHVGIWSPLYRYTVVSIPKLLGMSEAEAKEFIKTEECNHGRKRVFIKSSVVEKYIEENRSKLQSGAS